MATHRSFYDNKRGGGNWYHGKSVNTYLPHYTKARKGLGYNRKVRIYSVKEAAVILRHSPTWVRAQINAGYMKAQKYGGIYWIPSMEVTRWMGVLANNNAPKRSANVNYSRKNDRRRKRRKEEEET